jgi:hypothetical protein
VRRHRSNDTSCRQLMARDRRNAADFLEPTSSNSFRLKQQRDQC